MPILRYLDLIGIHVSVLLLLVSLGVVVWLYYLNNPLRHGRWFMLRSLINWFPLGMTYAFLYMGRYNLNVSKNALGDAMTNKEFGIIFAAGTITYALSFLLTLTDLADMLSSVASAITEQCFPEPEDAKKKPPKKTKKTAADP